MFTGRELHDTLNTAEARQVCGDFCIACRVFCLDNTKDFAIITQHSASRVARVDSHVDIHIIALSPNNVPVDKEANGWLNKRLEGKELMKLKNASLQQLIAGGFGQTGPRLYAIAANHINQAVLGFTGTTSQFKKQQQLPDRIRIPDLLNMQGQVARCYAETCFQKFLTDNLQRLRELSEPDLLKEFADLKLNLRQGFVSTGMGDLKTKVLTVADAKKRKADLDTASRKQQKLLQAEQPRAIECAA